MYKVHIAEFEPSFWVRAKYWETADSICIYISLFMSLLALRLQQ